MARPGRDQALAEPGLIAGGHLSEEQEWEETMNNDLAELTRLNHDYVASVQNSDVRRFDEILAADFYCSNPDKSLVDRPAFLQQTAKPVAITGWSSALRIRATLTPLPPATERCSTVR